MHRALSIPEVVLEIASHLRDGRLDLSDGRRDLSALALTARCFEPPTNAELYREVNRVCLLSLLERMLYVSGDAEQDARTRSRCQTQATLVRSCFLRSNKLREPFPDPLGLKWSEIHDAIILLRQPLYVFPNLHKLDVISADPEVMTLTATLLCPALRMISLVPLIQEQQLHVWEPRIFGFIEGLPEKAGGISSLEVLLDGGRLTEFHVRLANLLGNACRRLPLTKIAMGTMPTTPHLLLGLAAIDSLESIILHPSPKRQASFDINKDRLLYRTISGFRSLKKVDLREGALLDEIVRSLSGAPLDIMNLKVNEWGPHIASLLDVICNFGDTLTELYIQEDFDLRRSWETYQAYTLATQAFIVLSRCSLMQYFEFRFSGSPSEVIDLQNSDLELLAKSWPMLRHLEINFGGQDHPNVQVNLEALVPFSLYCPELKSIGLSPLSSTLIVPPSPCVPRHPWKALTIKCSAGFDKISSADASVITNYLNTLWPDVYLLIDGSHHNIPEDLRSIPRLMNTILSGLRRSKAMRPGSRWRVDRETEGTPPALSDIPDFGFVWNPQIQPSTKLPDACPWEIID